MSGIALLLLRWDWKRMSGQAREHAGERGAALDRQRSEAIGWLADYVVHEMRNRLGAIESATRLLLELEDAPERRHRMLEMILRSVERARALERQVRGLTPTGTGERASPVRMPADVLVREIVRGRRAGAVGRSIELEVDRALPSVPLDALDFYALLAVLLDQAIDHHRDEGAGRWIHVSLTSVESDESLRLEVSENGPAFLERPDGEAPGGGTAGVGTNGPGLRSRLAAVCDEVRRSGGEVRWGGDSTEDSRVIVTLRAYANPVEGGDVP